MPNAKLGAKVDRYSFFVRLLPPLLHTGLARRTNIPIPLTTPESLATGRLVAKQEVLWIFRQDCQPDTFQRRFPRHES